MAPQRWSLDPTSQRVVLSVLRRGPLSRAALGRLLGLSSASVTRLTKPLVGAGLLVEGTPQAKTAGRPALPLDIAAGSARFVGVKITRASVHGVLTDLRGTVLASRSEDLEDPSPASVATTVGSLVDALAPDGERPHALGASLGATVDADGLVRGARFLGWGEPVDLTGLLQRRTGLTTIIDNDVNAFAVSEHWFGVGRDCRDFAVVTIGAGVGVGVVADDELVRGHAGAAGLVGAVPVLDGRAAEDVLNADVIDRRTTELLGHPLPALALVERAASDQRVAALLDEVATAVGQLAGVVVAVTAPGCLLIAGEGAPLLAGRERLVADQVHRMGPGHLPSVEVVVEAVGNEEWARGAAALAIRHQMGVARGA